MALKADMICFISNMFENPLQKESNIICELKHCKSHLIAFLNNTLCHYIKGFLSKLVPLTFVAEQLIIYMKIQQFKSHSTPLSLLLFSLNTFVVTNELCPLCSCGQWEEPHDEWDPEEEA